MTNKKLIANADTKITEQPPSEFKLKELEFMFEEGLIVRSGKTEDFGDYDVSIGYKRVFFLRNPNRIYSAMLIDPHFTKENWEFKGPNMIPPLQTCKYLLTIPPEKDDSVDSSSEIEGNLKTRIMWQAFEKQPTRLKGTRTND